MFWIKRYTTFILCFVFPIMEIKVGLKRKFSFHTVSLHLVISIMRPYNDFLEKFRKRS